MRQLILSLLVLGLLSLAAGPGVIAQDATSIIHSQAQFVGITTLSNLPSTNVNPTGQLKVIPHRNLKEEVRKAASRYGLALSQSLSAPLSVPTPVGNKVLGGKSLVSFPGINTADSASVNGFSVSPPDQGLCAGGGFVVEIVNLAISVYSTKGALLHGPKSANSFFNANPADTFLTDPRCYFDRPTQRWFVSILNFETFSTGRSNLFLAVSQTNDPTGSYLVYSWDTTDDGLSGTPSNPSCPCFGDQPLLGADANGIYVSTNEFPIPSIPGFNGSQIYALSKTMLEQGALPTVVHINLMGNSLAEGTAYSLQPATSLNFDDEPSIGVEYFMSALDFNGSSTGLPGSLDNRITVWAMSNTSSLTKATPNVALTHVIVHTEVYGVAPSATQKVGPYPLGMSLGDPEELVDSVDDRMQQVVFVNGHLWSALVTIVSDGTNQGTCNPAPTPVLPSCSAGIAYFVVQPKFAHGALTASLQGQDYVSVKGNSVITPAIGVTEDGTAMMAFSLCGPSYFPSAAYAHITPFGSGPVRIAAAGKAPQDDSTGYIQLTNPPTFGVPTLSRWGDYSAAVVDGDSIWLATEYIPGGIDGTIYLTNWGTFVYEVNGNE